MEHKFFKQFAGIETERLFIRRLILQDVNDVFAFTSNSEVCKFLTWEPHQNIDRTASFIESVLEKYEKNEVSQWGIGLKENNKIIGIAGFINYWPEHFRGEVAFVLSPDYWGNGYMPEALSAILNYGFDRMNLNRIEAKCEIDNFASEKALQKIGMKQEGCMHDYLMRKGILRSYKFYAKLH